MKTLGALVKRNIRIYLKNKASIFFSFLSMLIIIGLNMFFLGNVNKEHLAEAISGSDKVLSYVTDSWLMAGIILVNAVMVTSVMLGIMVEDAKNGEEDEIIIRCHELDDQLMALIYGAKMRKSKISCLKNGAIFMVAPQDIFYFEEVDNRVFAYCEKEIYETKHKLYEIEALYENTSFFRASKATIINLDKMVSVSPVFNGRFEAKLKNGEKVIISRQYVPKLKEKLGM